MITIVALIPVKDRIGAASLRVRLNRTDIYPEQIVSANTGCITHLQSGTGTPAKHWVEFLDEVPSFDARLRQSDSLRESFRSLDGCPRNRQQPRASTLRVVPNRHAILG